MMFIELMEALGQAIQLAERAADWNLETVEIDGEMRDIYELKDLWFDILERAHADVGQ